MKKAIVTGGTGFLGRNLIRRLCTDHYHVYAVVRPESRNLSLLPRHEQVTPVPCALEDLPTCAKLLPKEGAAFFHFAWGGVNREELDDEAVQLRNLKDSMAAVQFAVESGCACFIDAGSRNEYGACEGAFSEDMVCKPQSAYGRVKLEFSRQAEELCRGSSTRFVHGRIFSVYGADDHPWSLIYTAVTRMMRNEPISLSGCTQLWSFMDVRDTSDLLLTFYRDRNLIPRNDNGIFNVASGDVRPLREFVEEIHQITQSRSALSFGSFRPGADSAISICPDMTKVTKTFGWAPKIDFADGIRHMICQLKEKAHA